MVWPSIAIGRISVSRNDDLSAHRRGPCDSGVEVVYLEPEKQAVSRRHVIRVANATVVIFYLPAVKLQDQLPGMNKTLVIWPAVIATATEQPLIPPAAGLDISD